MIIRRPPLFWIACLVFAGADALYGAMGDAMQARSDFEVIQVQTAALAWALFLETSYANTYRKIAAFLILLYTLQVAATDWALSWFPPWGGFVEVAVFVAIAARVFWRIHAVSRRQKAP